VDCICGEIDTDVFKICRQPSIRITWVFDTPTECSFLKADNDWGFESMKNMPPSGDNQARLRLYEKRDSTMSIVKHNKTDHVLKGGELFGWSESIETLAEIQNRHHRSLSIHRYKSNSTFNVKRCSKERLQSDPLHQNSTRSHPRFGRMEIREMQHLGCKSIRK
jgi:hypothetical protein